MTNKVTDLSQLGEMFDFQYDDREIHRGEIYYIDLDDIGYTSKHIANKRRPGLVIQNDVGNIHSSTTIVALMTTTQKKPYPFQFQFTLNERPSTIMFEQILTIDKYRVQEKIGELSLQEMKDAEHKLLFSLQLNRLSLENVLSIEVLSVITRKTKISSDVYFEVQIRFTYNQLKIIEVPLSKIQSFDNTITADISFDDLQHKLDNCKGLNWLANNCNM